MLKFTGLFLVLLIASSSLVLAKRSGNKNNDDDDDNFSPQYGLRFSSNSYVTLPDITIGNSFTIEFLIRWTNNGGPIVSLANNKDKLIVAIEPRVGNPSQGRLTVTIADSRGTTSQLHYDSIPINAWTYVAIVGSPDGRDETDIEFYVQDASSNSPSLVQSNSIGLQLPYSKKSDCYLGKSGSSTLNGDLDEVKIWSISLNKGHLGRNKKVKDNNDGNGLIGYWPFDEGAGDSCGDRGRNSFWGCFSNPRPHWINCAPVSDSTCQVWGRRVYASTFDNTLIKFKKFGEYYLVKDSSLNFQIRVDYARNRFLSAVTGLGFTYGSTSVVIDADFSDKADSFLYINNTPYLLDSYSTADHLTLNKVYTKKSHTYYISGTNPEFELKVQAYPRSGVVNVLLKLTSDPYAGEVSGLCGDYNGSPDVVDDIVIPVPSSSSLFNNLFTDPAPVGESTFECVPPESLVAEIARVCGNEGWVDPSLEESCEFDVCAAQDITAAIFSAEVTYNMNCNTSDATGDCAPPCPGYCSFQGNCNDDGVCECNVNYGGLDCSVKKNAPCLTAVWPEGSTTLDPFVGSVSGKDHYKYDKPYSESAATGNEISDATVIYFYQNDADNGTKGSFILINDQRRDNSGGKVSATIKGAYLNGTKIKFVNSDIVQDDPSDDYGKTSDLANGLISPNWKWDACCTDGIAITNLKLDNPFCINVSLTLNSGISQVFFAEQNLFGEQDLVAVPITNSKANVALCSQNCDNVCTSYSNCSDCLADVRCGWCSESETCEIGTAGGPSSGRCSYWRYSTTPVSRVVSTSLAYPVDPSAVSVYVKPNSGVLPVKFYVNFPPLAVIPHEVVTLVELTGSWLELTLLKLTLVWAIDAMTDSYPLVRLGLGAFSDKPISPYGSQSRGDFAYKTASPLTTSKSSLQKALNQLDSVDGGDAANSQLEALLQLAVRGEMGWSPNARHTVVVITRTAFHTPVGGQLVPNNGDGIFDNQEDYPNVAQVRNALLDANIVPIFVVGSNQQNTYQNLVNQLGFGKVITFSKTDFLGGLTDMLTSLDTLAGSATAVIRTPGKVSDVSEGFSGLSPYTRGTFTALVNSASTSTDPAVIVVPGFGRITINYISSDLPVTEGCVAAAISSTETKVIRLGGSSPIYGGAVKAQVTSGPTFGRFYQYVNGAMGDPLDLNSGFVQDVGLRVIYSPILPTANGTAVYSFKIFDECVSCSTEQTCSIDVTAVILPPIPVAQSSILETEANTVSDPFVLDGANAQGPVLPSIVNLPVIGKLLRCDDTETIWDEITEDNKVVPSKKIRYNPPRGVVGAPELFVVDSFTFKVRDTVTGLDSSDAIVDLAVFPSSAPDPIANSTEATVDEDTPSLIPLYATTAGTLTFFISDLPDVGFLSTTDNTADQLSGQDGPWELPNNFVWYFPPSNFNGETSFNFFVNDSNTQKVSQVATVTIHILPENDIPTVDNLTPSSFPMDSVQAIQLVGNDVDLDPLTYYICSFGGYGKLSDSDGTTELDFSSGGYVQLTGSVVYYKSPLNRYGTSSFTYTAFDGESFATPCASVNLVIDRVDITPVTQTVGPFNMNQSTTATITLVGFDANQDPLSIIICTTASQGTLSQTTGEAIGDGGIVSGVVTQGSTSVGKVQFVTAGTFDFGDNYAVFSYKVVSSLDDDSKNSSGCTDISINVKNVNDVPSILEPNNVTLEEDTVVPVILSAWDPDGDQLTFRFISVPVASTEGILRVTGSSDALVVGSETTSTNLEFVPVLNFNGGSSFSFVVSDPSGATSNQQHVLITVTPVNDAPTALANTVQTNEDTSVEFSLSGVDVEPYDVNTLIYQLVTSPSRGQLFVCNPTCNVAAEVNQTLASRNLKYVPAPDDFGTFSFTFVVNDGLLSSDAATVTIQVASVNDKPVPTSPLDFHIMSDESIPIVLGGTDKDNDPLTVTIVNIAQVLGLVRNKNDNTEIPLNGVVSDPDLTVLYTPNRNVNNTSPYTQILFQLFDGTENSDLGTVNIFVTNADLAPTGASVTFSGVEEVNLYFNLTGSDSDGPGTTVEFFVDTVPDSVLGVLKRVADDSVVSDGESVDGSLYFVPALNGQGSPYTSLTYHVSNNGLNSSIYTVTINLANVPDPPVIYTESTLVMNEDGFLDIQLLADDPDGDSVVFQILDAPENDLNKLGGYIGFLYRANETTPLQDGDNVTQPGWVRYVPHPDQYSVNLYFAGFACRGADSTGLTSNVLFVNIQVNPVNDAPVAVATTLDAANSIFRNVFSFTVTDVDAPPGFKFTITIDQLPVNGQIMWRDSTNQLIEVTQANNNITGVAFEYYSTYYGNDVVENYDNFTWRAFDGELYSNTARNTIDIVIKNFIPTPNFETPIICTEDTVCTFTMNATDLDGAVDGSQLRWWINVTTSFGTLNTTITTFNQDVTTRMDRQLFLSTYAHAWVMKYLPFPNWNSDGTAPDSFAYTLRDGGNLQGGVYYRQGELTFVNIIVNSVNDAPVLNCTVIQNGEIYGGDPESTHPLPGIVLVKSFVDANDVDARPTDILSGSVVCTAANPFYLGALYFQDVSGLSYFDNSTFAQIHFNGTLQGIKSAFHSGFVYLPWKNTTDHNNTFLNFLDNCTFTINDNGNSGSDNIPRTGTCVLGIKYNKGDLRNITDILDGAVAGAVAGSTTLVSAGIYGVYKLLKKKKILPEDADPWETDEYFDQTAENPLYSGTPTTSSAANVTLVTNDI